MSRNYNSLRIAGVPAALAASFILAACGERVVTKTVTVTETAPKAAKPHQAAKPGHKPINHVLTKADMAPPLFPVNSDYEQAATAAYDADGAFDFAQAQVDLQKVTDPRIRAQAAKAIDLSAAVIAVDDLVSYDFESAAFDLKKVKSPGLRREVARATDFERAETAIDDALGGYDFAQAKADQKLVHSAAMRAKVGRVIRLMKKGDELGAFNLADSFNFEDKALDISDSLGNRADNAAATLDRHSPSYHRQYEEAPNK